MSSTSMFRSVIALGLAGCLFAGSPVAAEGSAQIGSAQLLQSDTKIFIDIGNHTTETITWAGAGTLRIYKPGNNNDAAPDVELVSVNWPIGTKVFDPTSNGTHRALLSADQTNFEPWDIVVTGASATRGRVHSPNWHFDTGSFAESAASNASFYALVPGGSAGKTGVVELKLDGMSGREYNVVANRTGVNGTNAGRSVPETGNSFTPAFELYLLPPFIGTYDPVTPTVTNYSFTTNSTNEECAYIRPGVDTGTFEFTTNVDGVYNLVCDLNHDDVYNRVAPQDRLIVGLTTAGLNAVSWDGKDNVGNNVATGAYNCKVFVSVGELHFVGRDIETSYEGLRMFGVDNALARTPLNMFWNDTLVQSNDVNMPAPTSAVGLTTSGANGISSGSYASAAMPNVNAHSWGNFSSGSKGNNAYIDTFGSLLSVASGVATLHAVGATTDTDNDKISDYKEACTLGTLPDDNDSDNDGLTDTVETGTGGTIDSGTPIDTDGDGDIDALDTDSDNDGVNDGTDLDPTDENSCRDQDGDNCDDCSIVHTGGGDTGNDGTDTDGDDDCNAHDTDDDDDGVPDNTDTDPLDGSSCADSDGDGCNDCVNVHTGSGDADDDGLDTDGDGTCDLSDSDKDGDGVDNGADGAPLDDTKCRDVDTDTCDDCSVVHTGGGSTSNDGADTDGDGICNLTDPNTPIPPIPPDADGDGVPDATDKDADNDGIPNTSEGGGDHDGDGVPDKRDIDSDNDGIPDLIEAGGTDEDGDGRVDDFTDANADGIDDTLAGAALPRPDTDDDGLPDDIDLDSDADGITDVLEAGGGALDADADGRVDSTDDDNDNGWDDAVDSSADLAKPGDVLPLPDTDGDDTRDFQDADSDDDGVEDSTEGHDHDADGEADTDIIGDGNSDGLDDAFVGLGARPDRDEDGKPDYVDADDDEDSLSTQRELADASAHPLLGADPDKDGVPSYLDPDSDGDGVDDGTEAIGGGDINGDGLPDYLQPGIYAKDSDGDGLPDYLERPDGVDVDSDGDGIADHLDSDDDGDGLATRDERPAGVDGDADGDGKPNHLDADDDGDGVSTKDELLDTGGTRDSDADSKPDHLDVDDDEDGIATIDELNDDGTARDTDGDAKPDHLDDDDDGDSISTQGEVGADGKPQDTDNDGTPDHRDADDDGDSIPTVKEHPMGMGGVPADIDGDGTPNYLDLDSDGDTVVDELEWGKDYDEDEIPDYQEKPQYGYAGGALCSAQPGAASGGGIAMTFLLALGVLLRRRRADRIGA